MNIDIEVAVENFARAVMARKMQEAKVAELDRQVVDERNRLYGLQAEERKARETLDKAAGLPTQQHKPHNLIGSES